MRKVFVAVNSSSHHFDLRAASRRIYNGGRISLPLYSSYIPAMSTCLFLTFRFDSEPAAGETAKLERLLCSTPKLEKALVHSPASASDPYVKDGAPPALVLQLYFAELPELEAAVSRDGALGALASHAQFPVLADAEIVQQAMLVRSFAVPNPGFKTPLG